MAYHTGARWRAWANYGPPSSGTAGTLAGEIEPGAILHDTLNGVVFVNEGTKLCPYYTPLPYAQPQLFGVNTDWRDQIGKALADTGAAAFVGGSGLRIFGQGIAETDSGAVISANGEGGAVMRLTSTNEDAHLVAIGTAAGIMQPDQHQLLVVDVEVTQVTAITTRACGLGFLGTAADALDPPATSATTVATLVQDDMCIMYFDTDFTDGDQFYIAHNKSNAAATMTAVATAVDCAAAATYQRLRVEIAEDGDATFFIDKDQVSSVVAIALDVDEECSPVFFIESETTAVAICDVKRFATWAYR